MNKLIISNKFISHYIGYKRKYHRTFINIQAELNNVTTLYKELCNIWKESFTGHLEDRVRFKTLVPHTATRACVRIFSGKVMRANPTPEF